MKVITGILNIQSAKMALRLHLHQLAWLRQFSVEGMR